MDELIGQVSIILKGMWKHRWPGLMVAWVVAAIGVAMVLAVPDKYEASARIYVDTQSILKPLMAGLAIQPNVDQQVSMLSRTLISRPNMEKLVRMADLDLGTRSKEAQDALIDELTRGLQIKNAGRDNLYSLSYRDPSPDKAKRVVQSLVSIFIESSLGDSRKDSDTAKKFIDEQIKIYVGKLEEAEARLKEFKLRNLELQAGDGKDMTTRLAEVNAQLNQARLELREAENARDSAKKQIEAEKGIGQGMGSTTPSLLRESSMALATPEIDSRIDGQKRALDALLQRYTEQHPDVVGARRLIKDLEEQKRKEIIELRKTAFANPVSSGGAPVSMASQELGRLLATSEVQVASLRARVGEYEARYKRARELMKSAPQLEAEYTQLNRDYGIHQKNYQDLVSRRESATMSGDLEGASGVADFRLIDPPRASPKPVAPNRLLLAPMALLAALGAGIAAAFAMSQMRAVFFDPQSLSSAMGLPLLGVVTLVLTEAEKRREKSDLKRFVIASSSLVGLFIVGMIVVALLSGQLV